MWQEREVAEEWRKLDEEDFEADEETMLGSFAEDDNEENEEGDGENVDDVNEEENEGNKENEEEEESVDKHVAEGEEDAILDPDTMAVCSPDGEANSTIRGKRTDVEAEDGGVEDRAFSACAASESNDSKEVAPDELLHENAPIGTSECRHFRLKLIAVLGFHLQRQRMARAMRHSPC